MAKEKLNLVSIDKVRKYFEEIKPDLFQVTGHPLTNEEDYVKELYISLLCSIAAFDGDVAESESMYIKRIIKGANLRTEFSKIVKQGLEIKKSTIDEFVKAFSEKDLGYCFVADALVIAVSDGVLADKEVELIAELSEILKVSRTDIEVLSGLIAVLISQNNDGLNKFLKNNKLKTDLAYLIKSIFPDYVDTTNTVYFTGDVVLDKDTTLLQDKVIFENANVVIKKDVYLLINGNKNVFIKGCKFNSQASNVIRITNIANVEIEQTRFMCFKNRTLDISNIAKIAINRCAFEECSFAYNTNEKMSGGVIITENTYGNITDCTFRNCSIKNEWYDSSSNFHPRGFCGYFKSSDFKLYSNTFHEGGCYYTKDTLVPKSEPFYYGSDSKIILS